LAWWDCRPVLKWAISSLTMKEVQEIWSIALGPFLTLGGVGFYKVEFPSQEAGGSFALDYVTNWWEQPGYWKQMSHRSGELFSSNHTALTVLQDITGDLMDKISLAHNQWLLGCLGWMPLSLSAGPPAPAWPTKFGADTGCNLRPLRQRVTPCCQWLGRNRCCHWVGIQIFHQSFQGFIEQCMGSHPWTGYWLGLNDLCMSTRVERSTNPPNTNLALDPPNSYELAAPIQSNFGGYPGIPTWHYPTTQPIRPLWTCCSGLVQLWLVPRH
jgi:hypothetical protein